MLWFPGRFGGLVRKEQHYFRKLLDLWPGLLLVLAISVASLFGSPPPVVRQAIIVIVFVMNTNVIMNCFGLDTPAELNRYAILPLRGREVLLVKNLGLAVIVAAQLALLILTAALAFRSGGGRRRSHRSGGPAAFASRLGQPGVGHRAVQDAVLSLRLERCAADGVRRRDDRQCSGRHGAVPAALRVTVVRPGDRGVLLLVLPPILCRCTTPGGVSSTEGTSSVSDCRDYALL